MIAIDTNVLLRYLLWDDKAQAVKASKLINGSVPVLITDVVLTETVWMLKGRKYKLQKAAIIEVINSFFKEPNIIFEDGQTVWQALNDYRLAKPVKIRSKTKMADFSDALIVNKAKYCTRGKGEALDGFYTFDTAAQALPGTAKP